MSLLPLSITIFNLNTGVSAQCANVTQNGSAITCNIPKLPGATMEGYLKAMISIGTGNLGAGTTIGYLNYAPSPTPNTNTIYDNATRVNITGTFPTQRPGR